MAQGGGRMMGLAVGLAAVACGGRLGDDHATKGEPGFTVDAGASTDGATDTAMGDTRDPLDDADAADVVDARAADGWVSYTMEITSVTYGWTGTPPPPYVPVTPPSKGWIGRLDLRDARPTGDLTRGVITPRFDAPVTLWGAPGADVTLRPPETGHDGPDGLIVGGSGPMGASMQDVYDALALHFDADGHAAASATATGTVGLMVPEIGTFSGTIAATITLTPDRTPPVWRARAATSIATIALPWDARTLEASEFFEEKPALASLVLSSAPLDLVAERLTAAAWSEAVVKERGVRFLSRSWDAAPDLRGVALSVTDLAGNAAPAAPEAMPFGGAHVVLRPGSIALPSDAIASAYLWGAAKVATYDDGLDHKPVDVFQIGPFEYSYCDTGSKGGIATRLAGSGTVTATLRATARQISGGGYVPGLSEVVRMQAAVPGVDAAYADLTSMRWPSSPGPDGTFDSGWATLSMKTPGTGAESGVALGGGLGYGGSGCSGGPMPIVWNVTLYVTQVAVAP